MTVKLTFLKSGKIPYNLGVMTLCHYVGIIKDYKSKIIDIYESIV